MSNIIEIKNLSFSFHDELILDDITLSIPYHTLIGIIGPNGAGKTTLAKIILGLLKPSKGTISILGRPARTAREQIGYAPQHFFYNKELPLTILDVVLMGRLSKDKLFHKYTQEDYNAADKALKTVNLSSFKNHNIGELSGGQKQRVFLARALVGTPQILILDEAMTGVDVCIEFELYELLKKLKEKMTIILITHDIGVMSRYVDTVICLNKKIFCHDSTEAALQNLDKVYGCPVDIVAHGTSHRVLKEHDGDS